MLSPRRRLRARLTVGVLHGDDLFVVIQVMEYRGENSPTSVQLVVTHKVRMVTFQRIEDERFVGFWDLQVRKPTAVGEVELRDHSLHAQAGELGVHLDVYGLVGLYPDDKLVAGDIFKDTRCYVLELDPDLRLLLVEC